MKINLYRDWAAHLKGELVALGYDTTQMLSPESVVHAFLNVNKRLVAPIPRKVLREKAFYCPPEHLQGFIEIERKLVSGENVLPHLSQRIRNSSYNDMLLNDWGIHHLHLGVANKSNGFCVRTGQLLFARFDDANAYLIDVLPHNSWSLQSLVRKLHDNWPDSIAHYRILGALGLSSNTSDEDVGTLRKHGISTMVDLGGGVIYGPIGGGYSTLGLSMEVVLASNWYIRHFKELERWVAQNISSIEERAKAKGISFPDEPQFALQVKDDGLFAIEINCMVGVPLGKL